MENKPIVTCHGDQNLFSALRPNIIQGLPREPVEWRRSYGRPPRTINCAASFVPFNPDILPGDDDWTLLGRPFFHTYWTECDIDTYKSMVKDEIADWLASLRSNNINDWLIIVVVNDESKVKTKLLRTSVIDKVKSDFCSKQSERCVVLAEPLRMDSRSSESWGTMLSRMRQLLLQSFNKSLSRFEDYMRAQRERRTEAGWTFNSYFMLQEELAFMFEMLGLFEDALVQYDELDALFTQFVLNHAAGDSATWLHTLSEIACSTWDGLCLSQPINIDKRHLIKHNKASLLDFRNYLFSRQCTLLFLLMRPWEVAQRCIPFMHNCLQELDMLELKMPPGSVACWVFLSCLEVLQTCDKFTDTGQMETYSLYTASLWDYARTKMHDLGVLCGLMPESETSSEQLNLVVELIAGMTQTHKEAESEPLAKLREALSSKESFEKHYMELSELAMGTYKHIGRIRSARVIGRDLAAFYMKLNQPEKAEGFLIDALKTYKSEGWDMLADKTRLDIALCQKLLDNKHKYAKSCCHVASSKSLDKATRIIHQKEMMKIASQDSDEIMYMRCKPAFSIKEVKTSSPAFVLNGTCTAHLTLVSNLVEEVTAELVAISVVKARLPDHQPPEKQGTGQTEDDLKGQDLSRSRHSSMSSIKSTDPETPQSPVANPLVFDIHPHVEMAANNKTVITTGLVSKTPQVVKRTDSGPSLLREREAVKDVFDMSLLVKDVILKPGENHITLTGNISKADRYSLHQLCVQVENMEFLRHLGGHPVNFDVNSEAPAISVKQVSDPLLAGLEQKFLVTVCAGSLEFDDSKELTITGTPGLTIHSDMMMPDGKIMLPSVEPYDTVDITVSLTADLNPQPTDHIDHQMTLQCDWVADTLVHPLIFKCPLNFTYKLHTARDMKYVQVVVFSSTKAEFMLSHHDLTSPSPDVSFISLNKSSQSILVSDEQSASYVWKMSKNMNEAPSLTCTFSIQYRLAEDEDMEAELAQRYIPLDNYNTIYQVKSDVTPGEKAENCYAGALCRLAMNITKLAPSTPKQTLMYEVIVDPTNWAVCGKAKGVLTVIEDNHSVNLDIMPLMAGFLPLPALKLLQYKPLSVDKENEEESGVLTPPSEIDTSSGLPQLVPFLTGQVYNLSAASQVHVLPTTNTSHIDVIVTPL